MTPVRVANVTRGVPLARNARVADTHWSRLRGLLGRPEPGPDDGLLILPCRAVHTWGMRYPIDVALGDGGGRVVATYHGLRPWRTTSVHTEASWALELRSGTLRETGTGVGDEVAWEGTSREAATDGSRATAHGEV